MDALEWDYNYAINYHGEGDTNIRKGPWTAEEDAILADYMTFNGEGHWNRVACFSGLKRTGKSCRLRWLNYLRPNVRRGNITLKEQLLIIQLHSIWGNRWSKIAQQLPGRTDNEIKNYWRTRVQKLARQLKCDVNTKQFRDSMHDVWVPRLIELIRAADSGSSKGQSSEPYCCTNGNFNYQGDEIIDNIIVNQAEHQINESGSEGVDRSNFTTELSGSSSDSLDSQVVFDRTHDSQNPTWFYINSGGIQTWSDLGTEDDWASCGWHWHGTCYQQQHRQDIEAVELEPRSNSLLGGEDWTWESLWNDDNILFLHQQLM